MKENQCHNSFVSSVPKQKELFAKCCVKHMLPCLQRKKRLRLSWRLKCAARHCCICQDIIRCHGTIDRSKLQLDITTMCTQKPDASHVYKYVPTLYSQVSA